MDRAAALARLGRMVAAEARPVLTAADLDALLDQHRTMDPEGHLVGDLNYVPTWNLNAAAAEGWRWKAGRVAGDFTFTADDARYDKGAVLVQMEKMVRLYAAKDTGTASTGYDTGYESPRLFVNG